MSKTSKSGTAIAEESPPLTDEQQLRNLASFAQETTPYQETQMKQDTWDGLGLSPQAFEYLRRYDPSFYDQAQLNALDYTFRQQGSAWDPSVQGIQSPDDLNDDNIPEHHVTFGLETAPEGYQSPYDPDPGFVGQTDERWIQALPDRPQQQHMSPGASTSYVESVFGAPRAPGSSDSSAGADDTAGLRPDGSYSPPDGAGASYTPPPDDDDRT